MGPLDHESNSNARSRVRALGRDQREFVLFQGEPPQMPSAAVGKNGLLTLGFEQHEARTVLARLERRTPLLAQKALYWDETMPDMACVFVIMTSGCILGGDRLTVQLDLADRARAHVTTQAATKIHTMNSNFAAQVQFIRLDEDAYLEFMPDVIIPHRGSRFLTETRITIAPSATLLYSEILMPGRQHHRKDEFFGWDVFSSSVTASRHGKSSLFTEKFVIEPRLREVRQAGIMDSYAVFGNLLLLTPKSNADCILERIGAEVNPRVAFGGTSLPNDAGLAFKVLGMESHDVKKKIYEFWSLTREAIVGKTPEIWFWR